MPPAAILDVDGTLVDTNYQHVIAWYRALRSHGEAREIADAWTSSADVETTKPAPDLVVAAMKKLARPEGEYRAFRSARAQRSSAEAKKIDAYGAVMVGDSTFDCEAAGRAGVPTIGVLTGGFSESELREAGAVAVFESLGGLKSDLDETPLKPSN